MQDRDRIAEAHEAIDRRAAQRAAAAAALQEWTPEAISAEEERQRVQAEYLANADDNEHGPDRDVLAGEVEPEEGNHTPQTLEEKLSSAVQAVLQDPGEEPDPIGIGRLVFQWILVPAEDSEGYQLGIQLQVDEQAPAGMGVDITPEMLASWAKGKGLQGNRTEHKHFVAAMFDQAIGVGATETANALVYALEELMLWETRPTETSVGEDEPALPEMTE